jgi:hypothetical protein
MKMAVEVLKGAKGWETLKCGGILVHSFYDPLKEAEQLIQPLFKSKTDIVVIFGLGLGYHLRCILQRAEGLKVVVYEPDAEITQAFYEYGSLSSLSKGRVWVTAQIDQCKEILSDLLVYNPGSSTVGFFFLPVYKKLFPRELARFRETLEEILARRESNQEVFFQKKELWFENFLENIPSLLGRPDVVSYAGCLTAAPCFLVGAGPSLSRNIHLLKGAQGKAFIFSANAAFPRLSREGIQPDMTGILEGADLTPHLRNENGHPPTCLAIEATSHPSHFRIEAKNTFVFHSQKWSADLFGREVFLPNGGHVTSAGFTLGVLWGCNPIILVGQDLAFAGQKLRAEGTMGPSHIPEGSSLLSMAGMEGKPVLSHRSMLAYRMWYEESASYLKRKDPSRLLLNATEGGANISGIPNISLQEAIQNFCNQPFDFQGVSKSWPKEKPLDPLIPLTRVEEMVRRIDEFTDKNGEKPSSERKQDFVEKSLFLKAFFQNVSAENISLASARAFLVNIRGQILKSNHGGSIH